MGKGRVTIPTNLDVVPQTLEMLKECEAHATYIVTNGDLKALKSLKINITSEPNFYSNEIM